MKILAFTAILFLPLAAQAELTFCNGVWTNQSCSEEPQTKIDEKEFKAKSKDEVAGNKKKSLVHEMTMKRIEARRKYGVLFSSEDTEAVCDNEATSLDKCRKAVESYYKLLQENVRNQLDAESQKNSEESDEKAPTQQNQTTVNIINNPVAPILTGRDAPPRNTEISESEASVAITGNKDGINVSGQIGTKRKRRVIRGFDGGAVQTVPLNFNKKAETTKPTPQAEEPAQAAPANAVPPKVKTSSQAGLSQTGISQAGVPKTATSQAGITE